METIFNSDVVHLRLVSSCRRLTVCDCLLEHLSSMFYRSCVPSTAFCLLLGLRIGCLNLLMSQVPQTLLDTVCLLLLDVTAQSLQPLLYRVQQKHPWAVVCLFEALDLCATAANKHHYFGRRSQPVHLSGSLQHGQASLHPRLLQHNSQQHLKPCCFH